MDEAKTIRWLHFSDIHVGMGEQVRLWPRSSTVLLDDLETAHRKTDGFDLLVFSGDLAFKGSADEFDRFDQILERILGRLGDLGPRPPVVTVPGNHDLVRPDGALPTPVALSQFWNLPTVRERMWDASQPYLEFLSGVFENYSAWRDAAVARGIHLVPAMEGLLPGDASYVLEGANARTGIVALNSTWLQLGAGDYDKGLHVDARQLLAVTGGDADRWVRDNAVNLFVTHQPATWLHATSPESWDNDLNPAGRFDAHLFGHMHEPEVTSTSRGGGPARRNLQAASLFGLETYGEGHKRIQGYSANRIVATGADRVLTTWPRRLVEVTDGRQKLVPDTGQDIDEDTGALTMPPYQVERHAIVAGTERSAGAAPTPVPRLASNSFDLAAIRLPLGDAKAHAKVRRVEQEACAAALKDARAAWLAADWGMGEAGFVATVCGLMGIPREKVFGVDFEGYAGTEDFFDELRTRLGATFQEVCEAIAEAGPCVLVLDDVDVEPANEAAVEALVKPVRDFAADALILIRSRRRPRAATLKVVELKALDEADLGGPVGRVERQFDFPARAVIDRQASGGEVAVDLLASDRTDAPLLAQGDDRLQVGDALRFPPLRLKLPFFGRQERHVTAQSRQPPEIVDEGKVRGGVKVGMIGRRSLVGADLAQPGLVHRLGNGLKLGLGDSAFRLQPAVQHLHYPRRHRGQHRSPVARPQPVHGA